MKRQKTDRVDISATIESASFILDRWVKRVWVKYDTIEALDDISPTELYELRETVKLLVTHKEEIQAAVIDARGEIVDKQVDQLSDAELRARLLAETNTPHASGITETSKNASAAALPTVQISPNPVSPSSQADPTSDRSSELDSEPMQAGIEAKRISHG